MKVRQGFVSNSSSSSFIIAIPKGMQINLENIFYIVFPETMKNKKDINNKSFGYFENNGISAVQAAQIITSDLEYEQPNDMEKIKEAIDGYIDSSRIAPDILTKAGAIPKYPESSWKLPLEESLAVLNKYCDEHDEWTTKMFNIFKEKNMDCDVYVLEYSDESGSINAAMEHAGVFDEMIKTGTAISISHH